MHPTQHTTITPRTRGMTKDKGRRTNDAACIAKAMTDGLIELSERKAREQFNLAPLLSKAAKQSQPFRVRPAPMPQTAA